MPEDVFWRHIHIQAPLGFGRIFSLTRRNSQGLWITALLWKHVRKEDFCTCCARMKLEQHGPNLYNFTTTALSQSGSVGNKQDWTVWRLKGQECYLFQIASLKHRTKSFYLGAISGTFCCYLGIKKYINKHLSDFLLPSVHRKSDKRVCVKTRKSKAWQETSDTVKFLKVVGSG